MIIRRPGQTDSLWDSDKGPLAEVLECSDRTGPRGELYRFTRYAPVKMVEEDYRCRITSRAINRRYWNDIEPD